jgi:hypothetical protein
VSNTWADRRRRRGPLQWANSEPTNAAQQPLGDVYISILVVYTDVMRRTQIYFDEAVDQELRAVAAAEGRSAADLIREAVRRYLAEREGGGPVDPIAAMIGTIDGLAKDAAENHDRDLYTAAKGTRRRR